MEEQGQPNQLLAHVQEMHEEQRHHQQQIDDVAMPMAEVPKDQDLSVGLMSTLQDPSKQITKENVTKLNTDVVIDPRDETLSSPEGGIQSERSSHYDKYPIRGSSSAFLGSLTSASDVSSLLTSAFPSTDSLQSSEPSQESDSAFGSIQRDSLIEMAMPSASHQSSIDETLASASNSQATEPEQISPESASTYTNTSSPTEHHQSTPTDHDRILHDLETKTPPRTHTPSYSTSSTPGGDNSKLDHQLYGRAFYSSGKHDEEYEQSHSKTPLLYPSDYTAPKETDQAVKDMSVMGNKLINQYEALVKLGSGAHGTVKLGKDTKSGRFVAIKVVRRYPKKPRLGKKESPEDKVKKEVAVLKKAQHPHVVSLLEVIDDPKIEKVYLILEYVERGEIKWRKTTDRDIANFEMNRMKREVAGNPDEATETETLLTFNEYLFQRHLERLQHKSVTSSSASESYRDDNALEDYEERQSHRIPSRQSSRPSSRPASRPPSELDISATHTLRVPSRASQRDTYSLDFELSGSMYGSYVEDESTAHAQHFERQRWLADEPALEEQWTPEEEEYRYVPCLTLSEARDVFRDTVLGLEYLHYHGIIHRDIKPANLLWTKDYRVKISDFGVSYLGRQLVGEDDDGSPRSGEVVNIELAKTVGTPAFYAPELCDPDLFDPDKNVNKPQISGQIDVWALGITLYAMIYGRLPFYEQNEFTMYEKIARQEVVIPAKRLRGVDYEPGTVTNSNKRDEHILMYEDVDDELKDLIRRLLIKDPTRRITIKEVKHHPWLLRGMEDPSNWIQVTDPSYKGTKIEISQADLREAVVPRTFLGKVWNGLASITRGRVPSRRRAETSSKNQGQRTSASLSRSNTVNKPQRRSSLRGDETIVNILRATRDVSDHPLSRSTVATPTGEHHEEFFPPMQQVDSQGNLIRPIPRSVTTADSILTVKANRPREEFEALGLTRHVTGSDSVGSSSSSLAKIIDGTKEATRRITSRVRSRDPHSNRSEDMGLSSRASSGENIPLSPEGRTLKPSLAVSPALAAGHVEPPASLHPDSARSSPLVSPISMGLPSTDSFQSMERGRTARKRASTASNASWGQISPGLEDSYRQRLASVAAIGHHQPHVNHFLPLTTTPGWSQPKPFADALHSTPAHAATSDAASSLLTTGETITPAMMKKKQEEREEYRNWRTQQQRVQQDRFHQNVQQTSPQATDDNDDDDDGSDDEGIVIGGKR